MDARSFVFDARPSLFIRTAPDGDTWEFAATPDGRCVLLRGGELVDAGEGTPETVDRLLDAFLHACGADRAWPARLPAAENRTALDAPPVPPPGDGGGGGANPRAA
jgi:hypothetical protein